MSNTEPEASLIDPAPRRIGALEVGPIAYGLWRFTDSDVGRSTALIEAALDAGCNLIDTADVYGFDWGGTGFGTVEEQLGKVLAARPDLRDRMVLATKGGIAPPVPYDSSASYLRSAVDGSRSRLGVDHLDLYQIHRPDLFGHPGEVAETLQELVADGVIGHIGVSNYNPPQTRALLAHLAADTPLVTTQPEYSVACLDPLRDGTLDLCLEIGMVPLAWSPLGGGSIPSGEGLRPELVATLDRLAAREGVDRTAIAIAFVLAHPSRPVAIIGTQNPERIAESASALTVTLDRNDVYDLVEASEGVPLP